MNTTITDFTPEMLTWIKEGNAIKLGEDVYIEQSTNWKVIFTKRNLINFYLKNIK